MQLGKRAVAELLRYRTVLLHEIDGPAQMATSPLMLGQMVQGDADVQVGHDPVSGLTLRLRHRDQVLATLAGDGQLRPHPVDPGEPEQDRELLGSGWQPRAEI